MDPEAGPFISYCTIPYAGIILIKCIRNAFGAIANWV